MKQLCNALRLHSRVEVIDGAEILEIKKPSQHVF